MQPHEIGVFVRSEHQRSSRSRSESRSLEAQFMRAWLLSGRGAPAEAAQLMQAGLEEHRGRGAMGISPGSAPFMYLIILFTHPAMMTR